MQQTNYATQKREICDYVEQDKKAVFTVHCKQQSLRVHSQVRVHVPNSAKDQVPDGVSISRRTMTCVARCLVSLPIAESGPVAMTERSHRAR